MARGLGFAIEVNRNLGVATANFFDEFAQVQYRRVKLRPRGEFFVVNRQNKSRRTRLLLRKLRKVTIARDPEHFHALFFQRISERADTQA